MLVQLLEQVFHLTKKLPRLRGLPATCFELGNQKMLLGDPKFGIHDMLTGAFNVFLGRVHCVEASRGGDRKSTRLNSSHSSPSRMPSSA